jgi:hypothetical protein
MMDFQILRNKIQIFRNEIQAPWNKIQIRRNEIQIQILEFPSPKRALSRGYADAQGLFSFWGRFRPLLVRFGLCVVPSVFVSGSSRLLGK